LNQQASPPDIAVFLYEPGDGGLDRIAILLANGFAARGLATELWLTRENGASRHLIDPSLNVRMIPAPDVNRGLALALQIPALRRTVRSIRPRVLLSAGNQSNLPVALACLGSDTAAIGKITNPIVRPEQTGLSAFVRRTRFRLTMGLAALNLTLGAAEAQDIIRDWPALEPKIRFAHLPTVSDAMFAAGKARQVRPPKSNDALELIVVGRLVPQKDHATLLTALSLVRATNWRLSIIGDGPLRDDLAAQALSLGISDKVAFKGYISDPATSYGAADIMILSSRWEGLGAVVLEALACGCKVVTTESSPNLNAILAAAEQLPPVPVGDAKALAAAIDRAITQPANLAAMAHCAAAYGNDAAVDDHIRLFAPFLGDSI
jgi:glycosyltransferase involved in cell wall biosynthesis